MSICSPTVCRTNFCKVLGPRSALLPSGPAKGTGFSRTLATILYTHLCGNPAESPVETLVAHDCGYPLSRYTCRATRVAADFLDFAAFCRCSTGVALHPLKILVSHPPPPPCAGRCRTEFGSEKVSRYTGVSQLQLRVSRYTVQLRWKHCAKVLRKVLRRFYAESPAETMRKVEISEYAAAEACGDLMEIAESWTRGFLTDRA